MGQGPEGVPADAEAVTGVLEADGAAGGGRRGLPGRGQRQGHLRGGRGPVPEPAPRQESQVGTQESRLELCRFLKIRIQEFGFILPL